MKVPSTAVKAYKAIVIIVIVVLSSPIIKEYVLRLRDKMMRRPAKITDHQQSITGDSKSL